MLYKDGEFFLFNKRMSAFEERLCFVKFVTDVKNGCNLCFAGRRSPLNLRVAQEHAESV
jgi:hypothetical protein